MNDRFVPPFPIAEVATLRDGHAAEATRAGEPQVTFEQAYEAHFDYLWRAASHLGIPHADIEDVLHDVFLVVLKRLSTFEGRSSLRTWLYGILLREVQDRRRSGRRQMQHQASLEQNADAVPDLRMETPADHAAKTEAIALLSQLLSTLDSDRRDVLVMVDIEQMTVPDVANLLGEKINTVYTRLRLARAEFEAALDRHRARDGWRIR